MQNNKGLSIIIVGGRSTCYLTQELLGIEIRVRISEKRRIRCEELCELFPMPIIFHPTIWKQTFQRHTRR